MLNIGIIVMGVAIPLIKSNIDNDNYAKSRLITSHMNYYYNVCMWQTQFSSAQEVIVIQRKWGQIRL